MRAVARATARPWVAARWDAADHGGEHYGVSAPAVQTCFRPRRAHWRLRRLLCVVPCRYRRAVDTALWGLDTLLLPGGKSGHQTAASTAEGLGQASGFASGNHAPTDACRQEQGGFRKQRGDHSALQGARSRVEPGVARGTNAPGGFRRHRGAAASPPSQITAWPILPRSTAAASSGPRVTRHLVRFSATS